MSHTASHSSFQAKLQRPANAGEQVTWGFVVLPKPISETLPRRGRTSVEGRINGHSFQAMLEPDGRLSHWLTIDRHLQQRADIEFGDLVDFEIRPVEREPEPALPADPRQALEQAPEAFETWNQTTTLARVDWIHWVSSAKQAKTRAKRINDACDMLGSGKKRVCCFDPSGYYSKALRAPVAAEEKDQ